MNNTDFKYLRLLSNTYINSAEACAEIINLKAILHMPKGTEHFVSDIHGEYDSFSHVLKNASGVIKNYIQELFGTSLLESEKRNLATLVYYPEQKIELIKKKNTPCDLLDWYKVNLFRLMQICKRVSSKYTRALVRKALPVRYLYILEELIHEDADKLHKNDYYNEIIDTIIRLQAADDFIIAISHVIQRLAIDCLHVIGDIYDRGSGAERIMDILEDYHSVDIQWGNHDILWMGAASGSIACICNVIRVSAKYNNLHTIEEGYGINLLPLATFAMENYSGSDIERFKPDNYQNLKINEREIELIGRMHKAIAIIQFKAEADIIRRHPEYEMYDRLLLDKIDFNKNSVIINETEYLLADSDLPTVNPNNPYEFTSGEIELMEKLKSSFINSPKLKRHVRFLFNKGGMYKIMNGNVLFHGCVPLTESGELKQVRIGADCFKGKELLDKIDDIVRKGFFMDDNSHEKQSGLDLMWYLWCGSDSPLYGKDKMTTFERYFLHNNSEGSIFDETKDYYYYLRENEDICREIIKAFGLDENTARIINGHVPVMVKKGENPVKANGRLIVIDGGFTKAYQKVTGIAGYTLISNSQGVLLASHEPFVSSKEAVDTEADIISNTKYIEKFAYRKKVSDTDSGCIIKEKISDLEMLLEAYRTGLIKEKE